MGKMKRMQKITLNTETRINILFLHLQSPPTITSRFLILLAHKPLGFLVQVTWKSFYWWNPNSMIFLLL